MGRWEGSRTARENFAQWEREQAEKFRLENLRIQAAIDATWRKARAEKLTAREDRRQRETRAQRAAQALRGPRTFPDRMRELGPYLAHMLANRVLTPPLLAAQTDDVTVEELVAIDTAIDAVTDIDNDTISVLFVDGGAIRVRWDGVSEEGAFDPE